MNPFKAYDIRGVYNGDLTAADVERIGFHLPGLLQADRVLIGRDGRRGSPELFDALCSGITSAGADAVSIGLSTTPMLYFGSATGGYPAAVQITASHNPPEYNGLKICKQGARPVDYEDGLAELEALCRKEMPRPARSRGKIEEIDLREAYLDFLRQYLPDLGRLRIGVDCSNGTTALLVHDLFGRRTPYLNDTVDGSFPGHPPDPLAPENREPLRRLVLEKNLDLGLIFDGDGDRVLFIDEKGQTVRPDLVTAVLAEGMADAMPGRVLHDIRTSRAVPERIRELGGEPHMWKVGHSFAKRKLRELGAVLGGELAGHYYFRDFFHCDSGLLAALIVLQTAVRRHADGVAFSECITPLMRYANSGELNFRVQSSESAMATIAATWARNEMPCAVHDFDGIRMDFPDWWFNIRPSNTEPLLRLVMEARDPTLLAEKKARMLDLLTPFITT